MFQAVAINIHAKYHESIVILNRLLELLRFVEKFKMAAVAISDFVGSKIWRQRLFLGRHFQYLYQILSEYVQ